MNSKKIFITGATGALGYEVVQILKEHYELHLLCRNNEVAQQEKYKSASIICHNGSVDSSKIDKIAILAAMPLVTC